MSSFLSKLVAICGQDSIKENVNLSGLTTFKVGGPAAFVAEPKTPDEVAELVKLSKAEGVPFFVLGNGSNILASDKGFDGLIIHLFSNMNTIHVAGGTIKASAGASLIKVAKVARENSLTGLEFASGIPGTLGGAVYMNAGAYGGEMKDVVTSVTVLDAGGNISTINGADMDFSYRHSIAMEKEMIILSATLELAKGDQAQIDATVKDLSGKRMEKQPLEFPSAGSTFKRPEGHFAGKLIMDAGLRGYTVGGAQVSEKHCGFVVNKGGATAADVLRLTKDVQQKVLDTFGVELELEVKLLGDFT